MRACLGWVKYCTVALYIVNTQMVNQSRKISCAFSFLRKRCRQGRCQKKGQLMNLAEKKDPVLKKTPTSLYGIQLNSSSSLRQLSTPTQRRPPQRNDTPFSLQTTSNVRQSRGVSPISTGRAVWVICKSGSRSSARGNGVSATPTTGNGT